MQKNTLPIFINSVKPYAQKTLQFFCVTLQSEKYLVKQNKTNNAKTLHTQRNPRFYTSGNG